MYVSLAAAFAAVFIIRFIFRKYIENNKALDYGLSFFTIGIVFYMAAKFFNLQILSLRYGVKPEIVPSEIAEFASLFLAFVGLIIIFVNTIFQKFKKLNDKWVNKRGRSP